MELERGMFLAAACATLAYVMFKRRPVDWFSVAAASATVYFIPGFFGFVTDPDLRHQHDIEGTTYLVFFLVYASIAIGAAWHDMLHAGDARDIAAREWSVRNDRYAASVLFTIAAISLAFAIIEGGDKFWVAEKEVAMETHGRWMLAYEFAACLSFLTFVASGARRSAALAALLIVPTVFFGYRTAIVMTLIGYLMMRLRGTGKTILALRWPTILTSLAVLYALVFFKQVQFALKYGFETGHWFLLGDVLDNEEVYADAVFNSEPFLVQNTLNEVIKANFSVGVDHLESLWGVFLPFANELGLSSRGFNDYFQPALFSDVDYGLASNIWAQAYSLGGLAVVVAYCVFFVAVLTAINRAYARSRGSVFAALALVGAYWSFYIHRNDLLYEGLLLRRVLFFFAIGWLVSYLLTAWRAPRP